MGDLVVIQKNDLIILIKNAIEQVLDAQKSDKFIHRNKFSPKEAAEFTNRPLSYIRNLISFKKISYEKEGKLVLIARKDLLPLKK